MNEKTLLSFIIYGIKKSNYWSNPARIWPARIHQNPTKKYRLGIFDYTNQRIVKCKINQPDFSFF